VKPQTQTEPVATRRPHTHSERSRALALAAVAAGLDKKGLEPVLLDVRSLATYTDFIVVLSGRSDRQVQAVSDGIIEALAVQGARPLGTEGARAGQWTLIDYGDIVVHVFYHPVREFYHLESLWIDAPRVPIDVPPDARIGPETY
jgi:ribosome-associated protein